MLIKTELLGYRKVKKNLLRYVKPCSSDTGTSRTDLIPAIRGQLHVQSPPLCQDNIFVDDCIPL